MEAVSNIKTELRQEQAVATVSVVIPIYNEELYIEKCLSSVFAQSYDTSSIEIILVDGCSSDKTREIVEKFMLQHSNLKLLSNPKKTVQNALNIGIKNAIGEFIVRFDAHSEYSDDYIYQCVKTLKETDAFDVGGPMIARGVTLIQKVIAAAYHSPFALGGGQFHREDFEGYADTVFLGAYRRADILKIGLYDERFPRSEDDELSMRILESGNKIYITPKIKSVYYPRDTYKKLFKQYYEYGVWKPAVIRKHKKPARLSHLVPMLFVLFLILGAIAACFSELLALAYGAILLLYVGLDVFYSFTNTYVKAFPDQLRLMLVHFILHLSYGLGFLVGVKRFYIQNGLEK